jgi:hypothetical protein
MVIAAQPIWSVTMPNYRFYTGHQQIDPFVIDFASDREAIDKAKRLLSGLDIEVWQGARVIVQLRAGRDYTQKAPASARNKAMNFLRRLVRNRNPIRPRVNLTA